MKFCEICGKKLATQRHHLIYGTAKRNLSDEDGLCMDI